MLFFYLQPGQLSSWHLIFQQGGPTNLSKLCACVPDFIKFLYASYVFKFNIAFNDLDLWEELVHNYCKFPPVF